jgi:hypothetical protein
MKKQFLLFACAAVMLASCGSNEKKEEGQTQAQIDSTVAAKLAEHDAENAAKNDSTLKAMEAEKAAAMAREASNAPKKTKTKTKTTTTTTTKTETPPPPPVNPKEGRFNSDNGGAKPVDPASTKKKEDRFK